MSGHSPARTASVDEAAAPNNLPSSSSKPRPYFGWWRWGYIADYVAIGAIFGVANWVDDLQPFIRPIDLTDKDLTHPNLPNIVTSQMLFVYAVAVPIAVSIGIAGLRLLMIQFTRKHGVSRSASISCLRDLHHFIVGLAFAVAFTKLVTDFIKIQMGRFRPDFLSRCQYDAVLQVCTGDPKKVEDGRKSFPSGHSSYTFAGHTFLAIYLIALLEVWPVRTGSIKFDVKGALLPGGPTRAVRREYPHSGRIWKFTVAFLPLLIPLYVAISRLQQYIHHPTDVIGGGLIGVFIAIAVHYSRIPEPPSPVSEDEDHED
ncbi:hypothetical protein HDU97_005836 [Phlyctochytrium planicorne]|nr:hypothetical protein HDU97_005836 [Phlyctochytrium planicorne]